MKHDELCLINYYAIEILESVDNGPPSQKDISRIEKLLIDPNVTLENTALQKLIVYDFPEKKALLIEKDPLLQKAHYILLSNMGFQVYALSLDHPSILIPKTEYHAIFTRPSHQNSLQKLNLDLFSSEKTPCSLYLCITPEEKENIKNYTLQHWNFTLLELPLSIHLLYESLQSSCNTADFKQNIFVGNNKNTTEKFY